MTGSTRSSQGLDDRRKRLLFRCWHRGTREMDLILGRFADAEIAGLTDQEIGELEHLIEVPDPDLYAALTGDKVLPAEYATALFARIKAFRVKAAQGDITMDEALDGLLGVKWDAELEPFRQAGEGAPVRWLHQVI